MLTIASKTVAARLFAGLAVLLVLLNAAPSFAQMADQATISASAEKSVVKPGETVTINVTIDVAEGYHAQSNTPSDENYIPLTLKATPAPGLTFGEPVYPKGHDETYPLLGKLNVYTGRVVVKLPVTVAADAKGPLTVAGTVRYQACDDSACFPPKRAPFSVVLNGGDTATTGPSTAPTTAPAAQLLDAEPPEAGTAFGLKLSSDAYFAVFGAAFLAGIVFNAVPCVLPVVPLKIAGFYEAAQHDRGKCFLLGVAFSVGLVAVFAVLAVMMFVLKAMTWGELFTNQWFTAIIVLVLLAMAMSQFGLFTINLPTSAYAFSPRHDTYVGNAMFGVLTAVLSTPCTIGPFSGLLAWAVAQPPVLGASMLIVVGCGMASPYLVLSAFPQVVRRFPRTGPVGEIIKQTLAFLVLATAFYFARPFMGGVFTPPMFWWTLFAILTAGMVFLVVRTAMAVGTRRATGISGAFAVAVTAIALVVTLRLASKPYDWQPYSDTALAEATRAGRPVLVEFTADWCGNCHYLEAFVLNDPAVVKAVRDGNLVMLKADVTHGTEAAVPLKDKLLPTGEIPLTAVYRPGAASPALLTGVYSTADLLAIIGSPAVSAVE